MHAYLLTFAGEEPDSARPVTVDDDYTENTCGDNVPFTVGSNQTIVLQEHGSYWWDWCSGYCKGAGDFDWGAKPGEWGFKE